MRNLDNYVCDGQLVFSGLDMKIVEESPVKKMDIDMKEEKIILNNISTLKSK